MKRRTAKTQALYDLADEARPLSAESLLTAGFKEFPPSLPIDKYDRLFQKRVRDEKGTRYFVNVMMYDHTKYQGSLGIGWQCEITFNDGAPWSPSALQVKAFSGVEKWTAKQVEAWAAEVWDRLQPTYYETNE